MDRNGQPKNHTFVRAVKYDNVALVRTWLSQGANPNKTERLYISLTAAAIALKSYDMISLLVEYKIKATYALVDYIFKFLSSTQIENLLTQIIPNNRNDKRIMEICYEKMLKYELRGSLAIKVLKLLIKHGLSVQDYLDDRGQGLPKQTALHYAANYDRIDLVTELLKSGADINKKTSMGLSVLRIAAECKGNFYMVKLLINKGALVNNTSDNGITVLHGARDPKIIYFLIDSGGSLNIVDYWKKTPLTRSPWNQEILVKELAKMKLENQFISPQNLDYISGNYLLHNIFRECIEELQRMKNYEVCTETLLYDFLRMRNQNKKLLKLMESEDFVTRLESYLNPDLFPHYVKQLQYILNEAIKKNDVVKWSEDQLKSVFKNSFSQNTIRKFACLGFEDLILR